MGSKSVIRSISTIFGFHNLKTDSEKMGKKINTDLLICPICKSGMIDGSFGKISCTGCHTEFKSENDILIFKKLSENEIIDELDKLKSLFKTRTGLYNFLINVLSPVFIQTDLRKFIKKHINNEMVAINLGSGNSDISEKIINIDIFPYKNVNVCCDIEDVPFADTSVDVVMNIAVLEHVPSPEKVMGEIYRILKKGGIVYTYFPFMQPYHASPYDFSRRTIEGLKILHRDFEIKEIRTGAGPTSGFLWVFQEWIAILLSFGIKRIHHIVYLFIMVITFPLKYLDLLLSRFPTSNTISSAFIIIAQKK